MNVGTSHNSMGYQYYYNTQENIFPLFFKLFWVIGKSPNDCFYPKGKPPIKKHSTNKHKGKKFSPPFQRWQGSRGRRHLVALAAVVNYVYLRNPFVCGKNNQTDSGQIRKSIKPPAPKIQSLTNDNNISNKLKTLSCRRLETERCSVRNGDFSFRR